ncbi:MAG: hypothetical protein KME28_00975 [Pelatocladus maniniholoensis HA4357-MV3]|jgi:hypothetical protein|uniref:Uncharacterized protein n=1 Tax=Pelatocladus maniniholoensis HA4357-MV3 TaxID=1117104 RepID=A0A9E3LRZ1_9NOST|nr:hypothetical protein [Pelatocladus maniniholoensis HA4357-MV3]BAZ69484.1 hypothetical protein NIES4106_42570 [Fischerella sp. NIES-4106]
MNDQTLETLQIMRALLLQNLKFSIPTALAFTLLGYLISLPMSFLVNSDAARWKFHLNHSVSIETDKLRELERFQAMVALGGTVIGIVVAQTTFVVHAFAVANRRAKS